MSKAIFAGTFDPITRGHEDLMRRAARMFDHLVLGVADSQSKRPWFTVEERVAMAQEVLADCPNVSVVRFSGLLMDFARAQGAGVIVRGVRAVSDFDYEFQLAGMNRALDSTVDTVFLTPSQQYMFISATLVREIAHFGGDIAQFVPPAVAPRLAARVAERRRAAG